MLGGSGLLKKINNIQASASEGPLMNDITYEMMQNTSKCMWGDSEARHKTCREHTDREWEEKTCQLLAICLTVVLRRKPKLCPASKSSGKKTSPKRFGFSFCLCSNPGMPFSALWVCQPTEQALSRHLSLVSYQIVLFGCYPCFTCRSQHLWICLMKRQVFVYKFPNKTSTRVGIDHLAIQSM